MAGIIKVNQYQDFNGNTLFTSDGNGNLTTMKTNYPAFFARLSANQTTSDNVFVKIQCDEEILDTDGCYDNSTNYRFTPTVAGKYYAYGYVTADGSNSTLIHTQTSIYKNGSVYQQNYAIPADNYGGTDGPFVACVVDMNGTTDYLELYVRTNLSTGTPIAFGVDYTSFGAYRIGS